MKESSISICPVPLEQQPVCQYQELKESWFFSWCVQELPKYAAKLVWIWAWSWLISGPIAAASFAPGKHPVQFLLCGGAGAGIFVALILVRLYLGWSYIGDRLDRETVPYEESGWYDGQTWTKPPEVLTRDRLIVSYQIQPILRRLQRTFGVLSLFVFGGSVVWNLL